MTSIISFISQKGGTGKTTLSFNVAVLATKANKKVLLVDLDVQGSANLINEARKKHYNNLEQLDVMHISLADFETKLEPEINSKKYDIIILDTPPLTDVNIMYAAQMSNIILIPVKASMIDINAIVNSVKLAKKAGKPYFIVLNEIQKNSATDSAIAILEAMPDVNGKIIAQIGSRVAIRNSSGVGLSVVEYPDVPDIAHAEMVEFINAIIQKLK